LIPEESAKKKAAEELKEMLAQFITTPNFEIKPTCYKCGAVACFAVLRKDGGIIQAMCSNDVNMSRHEIRYCEALDTYHKRLKSGYFKGWRVANAKN
jgi:hypothetical protein